VKKNGISLYYEMHGFDDFLERFEKDRDNEALMRSWVYRSFSPKTFELKNYITTFVKNASTYPYLQSAEVFTAKVVQFLKTN